MGLVQPVPARSRSAFLIFHVFCRACRCTARVQPLPNSMGGVALRYTALAGRVPQRPQPAAKPEAKPAAKPAALERVFVTSDKSSGPSVEQSCGLSMPPHYCIGPYKSNPSFTTMPENAMPNTSPGERRHGPKAWPKAWAGSRTSTH